MCLIKRCFICRLSDSIVSEDAGIELRTVATLKLVVRRSNHSAIPRPRLYYFLAFSSTMYSIANPKSSLLDPCQNLFGTPPSPPPLPRKKHNFSNFDLHYCAGMHIKPTLCTSRKLSLVGAPHRESAGTYVFLKVVNCLFKG
jgi:hypothetical protein